MDIGLVTSLVAARQSSTREAISLSVVKQQHQMELSLVNMLADAVKNVPPPGQGTQVDTSA